MFKSLKEKLKKIISKKESSLKEKLTTKLLDKKTFEKIFEDIEITLLENNVAIEIVEELKNKLWENIKDERLKRGKIKDIILSNFKKILLDNIIEGDPKDIINLVKNNSPCVFLFLGVNGVGKTTNLAKFSKWLIDKGFSCVFSASDTFRAASIEQLEIHAKNLGIKLIKHNYNSDPAAVAFDAINYAKSNKIDCVLIDTAGRMHSNVNLMKELNKIKRVTNPNFTFLVVEALTGNDAIIQAEMFNSQVGVDGIIISKADIDEKGGVILSVSKSINKPIYFLGVGQEYKDFKEFNKKDIVKKLLNF